MIELAAAVTLATLAAGSAIVLALRALPTVRLQLAGLAFLAVVLPLGAVLVSGFERAVALSPEVADDDLAHDRLVVDDQYRGHAPN